MLPCGRALQDSVNSIRPVHGPRTGRLNDELTESMQRCISEISDACADRGGKHKASITLTLNFTMDSKDKLGEIEAALAEKKVQAARPDYEADLSTAKNPKDGKFKWPKYNPKKNTLVRFALDNAVSEPVSPNVVDRECAAK